jgi:uncharacterized cupin superfamily protein
MPTVKDVKVSKPTAEQIEQCKQWPIWECAASKFDWAYTQTETCYLLEGEVTVSDDEGEVTFGAGDMVVFPVDLECVWNITKDVRKHYRFD